MLFSALLLPLLAVASPFEKRQSPDPNSIYIIDTATSGSGCPQGTVSTSLSPDRTVVTFGFDSFQTYIGPGTTPPDHSKNCQVHLNLQYPGGFQYAIIDATYHGYARLDPSVTGTFYSTYFFSQDATHSSNTRVTISGSQWVNGNIYTKDDKLETTSVVWSPCGDTGLLNVNNRIALTSSNTQASGELSDDDATIEFSHQIHVAWRPCKA